MEITEIHRTLYTALVSIALSEQGRRELKQEMVRSDLHSLVISIYLPLTNLLREVLPSNINSSDY